MSVYTGFTVFSLDCVGLIFANSAGPHELPSLVGIHHGSWLFSGFNRVGFGKNLGQMFIITSSWENLVFVAWE